MTQGKIERYHESTYNVTPSDAYYGRSKKIIQRSRKIKKETMKSRRTYYRKSLAAMTARNL